MEVEQFPSPVQRVAWPPPAKFPEPPQWEQFLKGGALELAANPPATPTSDEAAEGKACVLDYKNFRIKKFPESYTNLARMAARCSQMEEHINNMVDEFSTVNLDEDDNNTTNTTIQAFFKKFAEHIKYENLTQIYEEWTEVGVIDIDNEDQYHEEKLKDATLTVETIKSSLVRTAMNCFTHFDPAFYAKILIPYQAQKVYGVKQQRDSANAKTLLGILDEKTEETLKASVGEVLDLSSYQFKDSAQDTMIQPYKADADEESAYWQQEDVRQFLQFYMDDISGMIKIILASVDVLTFDDVQTMTLTAATAAGKTLQYLQNITAYFTGGNPKDSVIQYIQDYLKEKADDADGIKKFVNMPQFDHTILPIKLVFPVVINRTRNYQNMICFLDWETFKDKSGTDDIWEIHYGEKDGIAKSNAETRIKIPPTLQNLDEFAPCLLDLQYYEANKTLAVLNGPVLRQRYNMVDQTLEDTTIELLPYIPTFTALIKYKAIDAIIRESAQFEEVGESPGKLNLKNYKYCQTECYPLLLQSLDQSCKTFLEEGVTEQNKNSLYTSKLGQVLNSQQFQTALDDLRVPKDVNDVDSKIKKLFVQDYTKPPQYDSSIKKRIQDETYGDVLGVTDLEEQDPRIDQNMVKGDMRFTARYRTRFPEPIPGLELVTDTDTGTGLDRDLKNLKQLLQTPADQLPIGLQFFATLIPFQHDDNKTEIVSKYCSGLTPQHIIENEHLSKVLTVLGGVPVRGLGLQLRTPGSLEIKTGGTGQQQSGSTGSTAPGGGGVAGGGDGTKVVKCTPIFQLQRLAQEFRNVIERIHGLQSAALTQSNIQNLVYLSRWHGEFGGNKTDPRSAYEIWHVTPHTLKAMLTYYSYKTEKRDTLFSKEAISGQSVKNVQQLIKGEVLDLDDLSEFQDTYETADEIDPNIDQALKYKYAFGYMINAVFTDDTLSQTIVGNIDKLEDRLNLNNTNLMKTHLDHMQLFFKDAGLLDHDETVDGDNTYVAYVDQNTLKVAKRSEVTHDGTSIQEWNDEEWEDAWDGDQLDWKAPFKLTQEGEGEPKDITLVTNPQDLFLLLPNTRKNIDMIRKCSTGSGGGGGGGGHGSIEQIHDIIFSNRTSLELSQLTVERDDDAQSLTVSGPIGYQGRDVTLFSIEPTEHDKDASKAAMTTFTFEFATLVKNQKWVADGIKEEGGYSDYMQTQVKGVYNQITGIDWDGSLEDIEELYRTSKTSQGIQSEQLNKRIQELQYLKSEEMREGPRNMPAIDPDNDVKLQWTMQINQAPGSVGAG